MYIFSFTAYKNVLHGTSKKQHVFVVTELYLRLGVFVDAAVGIIGEKFQPVLPYTPVDNTPLEVSPVTGEARQNIVASKARQFLWQCFGLCLKL
jgi:hypothetical protein